MKAMGKEGSETPLGHVRDLAGEWSVAIPLLCIPSVNGPHHTQPGLVA